MRAKQLVTIAVVSTLLLGGVAALGAASPADQANENAPDAAGTDAPGEDADDEDEDDGEDDRRVNGTDRGNGDAPGNADGVGPDGGLPEQVPDHVSEIHDRIDSYLNGSIDDLGGSLSELLGAGESDGDADSGSDDGADGATGADGDAAA
jgi:hypothetical protein